MAAVKTGFAWFGGVILLAIIAYASGVNVGTISTPDPLLEIARGNVTGTTHVNKFGRSTDIDSGVDTDIWDRANATDTQDIWVAPTQARIHQIASTSTSDDGDPVGVGARTLRVFYLPDWDTKEASIDLTMNGTTNVATPATVIIHRMLVLTKGATSVNVGTITATADTDGTVTAQVNAGEGQTQMAIYGVPSVQTFYAPQYYVSFNKASASAAAIDTRVLVNTEPNSELTNFRVLHTQGLFSDGNSYIAHKFIPYATLSGPVIIKLQGNGGANNLDASGGFDLILVDN